jgi:hypothetical protein
MMLIYHTYYLFQFPINMPTQVSVQYSLQYTPKWPISEPHGATEQQAIMKTPARKSAYCILSVLVLIAVLVFGV